MWSARTAKYASPKINPSSPNAFGTASEAISIADIAASKTTRIAPSSEAAVFWSQAYASQANQSTARIASPSTSRVQVASADTNPVTWVIANTNTRSKKSSSGVTRCSPPTGASSAASARGGAVVVIAQLSRPVLTVPGRVSFLL